jgi:A/G-specific adenine glycosylase
LPRLKQQMHTPNDIPPASPAGALLRWYDVHRRELAWRVAPGERPDPYRVWLSEIMLQQTTVAAVSPFFFKFVAQWPSVESLAAASLDDVLRAWAGLGYYARARNLHACAQRLSADHGGRFPDSIGELRRLPGIGSYTAGAIAAIAFGKLEPAIDGNVERVIARLHALETPLPDAKPEIERLVRALLPPARPGDFAQAMMDLGATVCTPRSPNCLVCPWRSMCRGRDLGVAESLPRRKAKRKRPVRHGTAFWVERADGAVLLRRRPANGLLGGMMEIPSAGWSSRASDAADEAPVKATWRKHAARIEHTFTHFHLILDVWRALRVESGELLLDGDYRWVERRRLPGEALPSVMRKIVAAIVPAEDL